MASNIIKPQKSSTRSAVDSVVGLVQEVIPQSTSAADQKDPILRVNVESVNYNGCESIFVVIGYENGNQLFHLWGNGNVEELISLKGGPYKHLKLIPRNDKIELFFTPYNTKTPHQYSIIFIREMSSQEQHTKLSHQSTITNIHHNHRFLIVCLANRDIIIYDVDSLQVHAEIKNCYPGEGLDSNPVAVGDAWLAYSDTQLYSSLESRGEVQTELLSKTLTSTAISAAQSVVHGVGSLFSVFKSDQRKSSELSSPVKKTGNFGNTQQKNRTQGVVTIVNVNKVSGAFETGDGMETDAIIAHFQAMNNALSMLQFDQTGTLLFTADISGHYFNVFRIRADICRSELTRIEHLYTLHRGDTDSQVIDCTFSCDSRWISVCTSRGTCHVFPINPYGGEVTWRTHSNPYVVNKHTAYQKSAGLTEGATLYHDLIYKPGKAQLLEPRAQIKRDDWLKKSGHHSDIPNKQCSALFTNRTTLFDTKISPGWMVESQAERPPCDYLLLINDTGLLTQYELTPTHFPSSISSQLLDKTEEPVKSLKPDSEPLYVQYESVNYWNLQRFTSQGYQIINHAGVEKIWSIIGEIGVNQTSVEENEFTRPFLSQVEIVTYAGPSRRLWMGPQFSFKHFQSNSVPLKPGAAAVIVSDAESRATDSTFDLDTDVDSLPYVSSGDRRAPIPSNTRHRLNSTSSNSSNKEDIFIEAGSFDTRFTDDISFDLFEDALTGDQPEDRLQLFLAEAMTEPPRTTDPEVIGDLMRFEDFDED